MRYSKESFQSKNRITLNKQQDQEFKIGDVVFCIAESSYEMHLTKHNKYLIAAIGEGSKESIRIKGNANRLVWISNLHFSKIKQAEITKITIDDEIRNPIDDSIEVTISFTDGTRSWLNIMTPNYLSGLLDTNKSYFNNKNSVFIKEISESNIHKVITEMDKSNSLLEVVKPY